MAEIPIPENYKPQKKGTIIVNRNYNASNYKKQCYAKTVSLDLQQKYQETVYPVCPVLRKWIKKENGIMLVAAAQVLEGIKKEFYRRPNLITFDSIVRILKIFESLILLKPDLQTVVKCAHTEDLLKGRLDLIRNELLALPQSLEKDFPETSKECKELIAGLELAELRYFMHGQSLVYILPSNLDTGNWATFLRWRGQQVNFTKESDKIEMLHLTRHYPAEAIKVMREIHQKLSPLVKILPERALEAHRHNTELKEILNEHLNKVTTDNGTMAQNTPTEQNGGNEKLILTENQRKILKYLNKEKIAVAMIDIETSVELSKNTVSDEVAILKQYGYIAPPTGKKRRVGITQNGIDCLNTLQYTNSKTTP